MSTGITIEQSISYGNKTPINIRLSYKPIEKKDDNAKNYLNVRTADEYYQHVVEPLMSSTDVQQKTTQLYVFPLSTAEEYITMNKFNRDETGRAIGDHTVGTEKDNSKNNMFLVFSTDVYDQQQATMAYLTINQMSTLVKSNLQSEELMALIAGQERYKLNVSAYGMWTMNGKDLGSKYKPETANLFSPNPESWRVFSEVPAIAGYDGINIPTTWGDFNIDTGGHLAISKEGYEAFAATATDPSLLREDRMQAYLTGGTTILSVHDVYGIEPGFVANNYKPVEVTPQIVAASVIKYTNG